MVLDDWTATLGWYVAEAMLMEVKSVRKKMGERDLGGQGYGSSLLFAILVCKSEKESGREGYVPAL